LKKENFEIDATKITSNAKVKKKKKKKVVSKSKEVEKGGVCYLSRILTMYTTTNIKEK